MIVANDLGPVRQIVVTASGDLYAALSAVSGDGTGGVLALRDTDGDGMPTSGPASAPAAATT